MGIQGIVMPDSGILLAPSYIWGIIAALVSSIVALAGLVYGHLYSRIKDAEKQIVIRQELQHKDRAALVETTDRVTLLEMRMDDHLAELKVITKIVSQFAGWDDKQVTMARYDARLDKE